MIMKILIFIFVITVALLLLYIMNRNFKVVGNNEHKNKTDKSVNKLSEKIVKNTGDDLEDSGKNIRINVPKSYDKDTTVSELKEQLTDRSNPINKNNIRVRNFEQAWEKLRYILSYNIEKMNETEYEDLVRKACIDSYNKKYLKPRIKLNDIPHKLKFESGVIKLGHHHGQRKLILNEIQFLSKIPPDSLVVYPGSAEGNKNYYLSNLFPDMKFIMIDPNPFKIYLEDKKIHYTKKNDAISYMMFNKFYPKNYGKLSNLNFYDPINNEVLDDPSYEQIKELGDKIYDEEYFMEHKDKIYDFILNSKYKMFIFNDFMTNGLCRSLQDLDVYFISDIRTNTSDSRGPHDADILWNSAQMYNWLKILKPNASILKLRLPWLDSKEEYINEVFEFINNSEMMKADIDFAKEHGLDIMGDFMNGKFSYFDGEIYLQPFAPKGSTESRLVIFGDQHDNVVEYDNENYDQRFQYSNSIERSFSLFENDNANISMNFDHCFGCSLENVIWKEYIEATNSNKDVRHHVRNLTNFVKTSRFKRHGDLFEFDINHVSAKYRESILYKLAIIEGKHVYKKYEKSWR